MLLIIRVLLLLLLLGSPAHAQMKLSNYYPKAAAYQDTLYIVGSGFGTDPEDIVVYLGKGKATISSLENRLIKVTVPLTATFGHVTVTKLASNTTAYFATPFLPVYQASNFEDTHISDAVKIIQEEDGLNDLCACDFDLDGDHDIATVNNADAASQTSVNVFSNNTSNPASVSFTKVPGSYFNINQTARNVICDDLDGDGKPELVVSQGGNVAENIFIFKNTSPESPITISFANPLILSTSFEGVTNGTRRLAIHDLDGDHLPEIIVSNQTARRIVVFKNASTDNNLSFPSSERRFIQVPENTLGLAINDMNGDQQPDIIAGSNLGSNLYVLLNESTSGDIQFAPPQTFNLGGQLVNLAAGDIDGDRQPDIVLTDFEDGAIVLLLNQSSREILAFASPVRMNAAIQPWGITLADIAGNQQMDIVASTLADSDKLIILKNNSNPGDPNFELIQGGTASRYRNLAIADINNDTKPDIVTTEEDVFGNFHVTFIQNKSCRQVTIEPSSPSAICEAQAVVLRAPAASNVTYQWFRNGVAIGGADQPSLSVSTAGNYTVRLSDPASACVSTSSAVTVSEDTGNLPDVPDITAPAQVCEGEDLVLNVPNNPALTYSWWGPNEFESTEASPVITAATVSQSGVYWLEVMQGACKSTIQSVFVEVVPAEELNIEADGPLLVCPGEVRRLSISSNGLSNIQWFKDGQAIGGANSAELTVYDAGNYSAEAQNTASCVVQSNTVNFELASLEAGFAVDQPLICTGASVSFNNQAVYTNQSNIRYLWEFGDGQQSSEANPVHRYPSAGSYTVTQTVFLEDGSCSSSDTLQLTVQPFPQAYLRSPADYLCPGDTTFIEVVGDFSSVQWEDGPASASRLVHEGGTYTATVTNAQGCDTTLSFELEQKDLPVVQIEVTGMRSLTRGDSVQLLATGGDYYDWSPSEGLSDTTIANPIARPTRTTTYTVTAYQQEGCTDTATVTITVDMDAIRVDALDIFSPNGDGIEDQWIINDFDQYPECYFLIFDLYGREVYRAAAPYQNNWEGTDASGKPLPVGTYYYVVRCGDGQNKASGSVSIVR